MLRRVEAAVLELDLDPREPGTPAAVYDLDDPFYAPLQHASSVKRPGPRLRIWRLPAPLTPGATGIAPRREPR